MLKPAPMAAKRTSTKKKHAGGRPKTGNHMVGIWMQPATHELLRKQALDEQRKMSTVAERLILEGIKRLNEGENKTE